MSTTLQDRLDAITENTRALVQPDRLVVVDQVVEELFESGIEDRLPPIGSQFPSFELAESNRRTVKSDDLLALGPVIINFFRGRWCPYCVTELESWRDLYPQVRERGALLIAISPQSVRQNDFTAQQHKLPFALLRDAGCTLAQQLGIAWTPPQYYRDYLRSILVNIPFINNELPSSSSGYRPGRGAFEGPDANGDAIWRMPLPATFVVRQDGTIAFAEAHADFRVRPEPAEILNSI
jgi:peroxiredoxin